LVDQETDKRTDKGIIPPKNQSLTLYALGAIFLAPLLIGVVLVRNNADRTDIANQVSRDIASMYAQGVDFSQAANQSIALRVAEGAGLRLQGGQGVVILSKLRVVREGDCADGPCPNLGRPVVVERFVIGSGELRPSSFGLPNGVDSATGKVANWATDLSARAGDAAVSLKTGEFTYAAECYIASPDNGAGVYTRAMF
jgi:hypothetical protein